jgi:hypothetical protein
MNSSRSSHEWGKQSCLLKTAFAVHFRTCCVCQCDMDGDVCADHLTEDWFKNEALNLVKPFSIRHKDWDSSSIEVLLDKFRTLYNGKRRTNFDDSGDLSDDAYHTLTRLSKDEFHHLVKEFSNSNIQNSCHRSIRTVVGIYLCKLRQGLSNSLLAIIFEMPDKRVVSRTINSARKAIMEHFIPYNLGFGHVTRQGIIDRHTKTFTEGLMCGDDTVILVIDDTYIYIFK